MGLHQRVEADYEEEEYDEYEEENSEPEEEHEPKAPKPTMEEQEFLKLREQLKEKIRQKMKKQSANASSHFQSKKRTIADNKERFANALLFYLFREQTFRADLAPFLALLSLVLLQESLKRAVRFGKPSILFLRFQVLLVTKEI